MALTTTAMSMTVQALDLVATLVLKVRRDKGSGSGKSLYVGNGGARRKK